MLVAVTVQRWGRLIALLLAGGFVTLLIALGLMSAQPTPQAKGYPNDFVQAKGSVFTLGGRPYRFVGFNLYDAAAAGETFYSCVSHRWPPYTAAQLDSALAYMHRQAGATVLRFWAYQTYTESGTNWSGIDEVLRLARRNGIRVIPVIEDGPGNCTTGPTGQPKWKYQGNTWYTQGYKVPYGTAALSYRDYVKVLVAHYKNNPTILGWEMMNEATTARRVRGQSAIVGFARDIGSLIHSIDHNHLVTVGTESDGWPGASGPDFSAVYGLPQINFAVAHDYQMPGQAGIYDPFPMNGLLPGGALPSPSARECQPTVGAPLACSVAADVKVVHKPMVIEEAGVPARSSNRHALQARANLFNRKLKAAFTNGVSGELVWDFNKVDDVGGGNFDVEQFTNDPLVPVMKRWSKTISLPPFP